MSFTCGIREENQKEKQYIEDNGAERLGEMGGR